jgi:hypothetical protein
VRDEREGAVAGLREGVDDRFGHRRDLTLV